VYNYSMDARNLRGYLHGLPVAELRWFDETASTNLEAIQWAASGAEDFSLVVADRQSQGRGRLGRKWITIAGAALAFSIILRPTQAESAHLGLFSPLGALAVASALSRLGLQPLVKWPNDVLLNRKKTCGILAEAVWTGQHLDALVLGIGVNVAPPSVPPPGEVLFPATCVESELGTALDRFVLLSSILQAVGEWRACLGKQKFMDAWQSRLAFVGEQVLVSNVGNPPVEGALLGIDGDGGLRIEVGTGEIMLIQVGDVQLRPHS
jgi:BirA family biotin operon repressor/biotin-[acetyl-CoA-carboxylase] ligase